MASAIRTVAASCSSCRFFIEFARPHGMSSAPGHGVLYTPSRATLFSVVVFHSATPSRPVRGFQYNRSALVPTLTSASPSTLSLVGGSVGHVPGNSRSAAPRLSATTGASGRTGMHLITTRTCCTRSLAPSDS